MRYIIEGKEVDSWPHGTRDAVPLIKVADVQPPVHLLTQLLVAASEAARLSHKAINGSVILHVDGKEVGTFREVI
ncbi:hypothetical protein [Phyllobacterium endophyticum]|jgi:hypothetical protein|uniref:Uncharacterized protein n=1 Tax=Phyllobacterium endophyticum TaxID=1149773 RepID=A0A2P7B0G5_9HYPH|nr:hypothetical protein [Phyllobacterium endophyticum]MBB3235471.1 hypothetical protein [Phyllobacterium endophyticum]PSH59884.1 hypothetical protein CU100_03770 [Phyllobacterium endophyticum]TXR50094.1 hypothetical protein FVA77_06840 [Phyllobacterium endophyticum]TYR42034.1 hypothetical protein FY050_12370 [Phyllobacterium endophyticum]